MEKTTLYRKSTVQKAGRPKASNYQIRDIDLEGFYLRELVQGIQSTAIRGEKDELVCGRSGIRLLIPAGSFRDPLTGAAAIGDITVNLIELMNTTDMMLTRRPTTSGNALLETGGAFAFSAQQNDRPLKLGNPINARIPTSWRTTRPDLMSVFTAPLRSSRSFDWSPSRRDAVLNAERSRQDGYYELEVSRPQWINCDYFYRQSRANMEFVEINAAPPAALQQQHAFLLFKDINAVAMMMPSWRNRQLSFRAPKGEEALIAMIGTEGEAFFFGTLDINTGAGSDFTVPLNYTPPDEIREKLTAVTGY